MGHVIDLGTLKRNAKSQFNRMNISRDNAIKNFGLMTSQKGAQPDDAIGLVHVIDFDTAKPRAKSQVNKMNSS